MGKCLELDSATLLCQGEVVSLGNLEICYAGVSFLQEDRVVIDFTVFHCERSWIIHCHFLASQVKDRYSYVSGINGDRYILRVETWDPWSVTVFVSKVQES